MKTGDALFALAQEKNRLQAMQIVFPLTHFLRIVRGILLKGNDLAEIAPNVWPIGAFFLAVSALALLRYGDTLD